MLEESNGGFTAHGSKLKQLIHLHKINKVEALKSQSILQIKQIVVASHVPEPWLKSIKIEVVPERMSVKWVLWRLIMRL